MLDIVSFLDTSFYPLKERKEDTHEKPLIGQLHYTMGKGKHKNRQRISTKTEKNNSHQSLDNGHNVGGKRKSRGNKTVTSTKNDYMLRQSIIGE